ncbi:hypothetical protein [Hahella chejuensis]|uniref:hypothetical protein n=1 Tax=Hahella chejuensis TaxID=158327 RepID=UPI0005A1185F|nr:hypothetical protein [Hahella chejuensis]
MFTAQLFLNLAIIILIAETAIFISSIITGSTENLPAIIEGFRLFVQWVVMYEQLLRIVYIPLLLYLSS